MTQRLAYNGINNYFWVTLRATMAKKQKKTIQETQQIVEQAAPTPQPEVAVTRKPLSIVDFKVQAAILAIVAFLFYANTYMSEYAHDDGIVIIKNEYVMEGFAGLKGIFTKDAYDSYYRQLNTINQLSGGRYRPLSIATFAIEQQLFGPIPEDKIDSFLKTSTSYGIRGPAENKIVREMHVRHIFNVFWYMACVVVLLYFLRYVVFKKQPEIAFLAALLFTIHPIHTEVVANVKSRDEIMSLLFMCLTFIFAFKYEEQKKLPMLAASLFSFFLAFLSKEYAITLVALLPLTFYLFNGYTIPKSIRATLPYLAVVLVYVYIRIKIATGDSDQSVYDVVHGLSSTNENSEKEVLNNPYYYATPIQKIATEISTSLNYLKLLFYPHPLSADYSYNSIPYQDFSHWQVILSIIVHSCIIGATAFFVYFRKNYKILAFAFAFYILHLLLVNNLIFNIGATMGERLIFHSSVGFSIVMAMVLFKGYKMLQPKQLSIYVFGGLLGIVVLLSGYKTITRNADWKNDRTLFMQDIKVVPNSVLVNGNVAASYISMADFAKDDSTKKVYLRTAIKLLGNAISARPGFVAGFLNQGIAYYKLGIIDSAEICIDSVKKNYPNYPSLKSMYSLLAAYHMKNGWTSYGQYGKYPQAIAEFKKGLEMDPQNGDLWYNLGGAYFSNKQPKEAIEAWQNALKFKPNDQQTLAGMNAARGMMQGGAAAAAPNKQPGK